MINIKYTTAAGTLEIENVDEIVGSLDGLEKVLGMLKPFRIVDIAHKPDGGARLTVDADNSNPTPSKTLDEIVKDYVGQLKKEN